MAGIAAAFEALAALPGLTARFQTYSGAGEGEGEGEYFNYSFDTERAGALWRAIRSELYAHARFGPHLRRASMAMCSSQAGWSDYLLLFHFDPAVRVDDASSL